ncbi:MAG: hypothetical protein K5681_03135 [Treponema sp.]|nr:hypothetical protein [Treponema sp.]
MKKTDFFNELYKLYGTVTRARGCFLYTKKGERITDLYQENGRAILGWEGGSAFTFFKNTLSRGQTGSFITEVQNHPSRLARAASELTETERCIFAFPDKMSALKAGLAISSQNTSFYKPWAPDQDITKVDCAIIIPPLPWTDTIYLLAVKTDLIPQEIRPQSASGPLLPGSIPLPFALETALTRAIYNLKAELNQREEKDWFIYDPILTKYWERKGPYLFPKVPAEKYDAFVLHCLSLGLAINPEYSGTSIVPYKADPGVFTKLKKNPFDY